MRTGTTFTAGCARITSKAVILASGRLRASEAAREAAQGLGEGDGLRAATAKINSVRQPVHRRSTFLQQFFHSLMPEPRARRVLFALVAALTAASSVPGAAQSVVIDAGAVFRVFLKSGQALPSYGESAIVGDRVVFSLLVGGGDSRNTVQLMSLPADRVDLVRTRRYADALRARHYAATRGEVDYAAMTQEVQRTLAQLTSVADPRKRLELAEEARRRVVSWAAGTYGYRAADVRVLTGLFDEVIAELRAAAGERQFAVDLRTGPDPGPPEPLLDAPSPAESIQLALEAARAADGEEDRLAVLRAAETLATTTSLPAGLYGEVRRELEAESRAAESYATLFSAVRAKADVARRRGDVAGVESALAELRSTDEALGGRRPTGVEAVVAELGDMLEKTRTYRAALDRYALVRGSLLRYERTIRPVMSGLDGLAPVLDAVRDFRHTAYERLERSSARLEAFRSALTGVEAPVDLADVHATLDSALKMADYACARRRLAVSTLNEAMGREASAAAAGALMLAGLAREQLVARLYPPKIQ
jgi:hypothetical protein